MRTTKHVYQSTKETITLDELNQEDIVKIEERLSGASSFYDRDYGIDKDGNIYFNVQELTSYHKGEYSTKSIVIVLPEVIKKAINNAIEKAAYQVRKDIKRVLKIYK